VRVRIAGLFWFSSSGSHGRSGSPGSIMTLLAVGSLPPISCLRTHGTNPHAPTYMAV
jgi:hypothetical protein